MSINRQLEDRIEGKRLNLGVGTLRQFTFGQFTFGQHTFGQFYIWSITTFGHFTFRPFYIFSIDTIRQL